MPPRSPPLDVASPRSVAAFFVTAAALGPVSALVNNAGIVDRRARVDEMTAPRLRRMFAVNSVGPLLCAGEAVRLIETGIHATGGEPDRVQRLGHKVPMQRGGRPEEVATTIAWLCSAEASYVTGAIVVVSGGR